MSLTVYTKYMCMYLLHNLESTPSHVGNYPLYYTSFTYGRPIDFKSILNIFINLVKDLCDREILSQI